MKTACLQWSSDTAAFRFVLERVSIGSEGDLFQTSRCVCAYARGVASAECGIDRRLERAQSSSPTTTTSHIHSPRHSSAPRLHMSGSFCPAVHSSPSLPCPPPVDPMRRHVRLVGTCAAAPHDASAGHQYLSSEYLPRAISSAYATRRLLPNRTVPT